MRVHFVCRLKALVCTLVVLALVGGTTNIVAQIIIRDQRAKDTAVTPNLGRGFSLSTNSYQSTCLADVVLTQPSYDFSYEMEEIKAESFNKTTVAESGKVERFQFASKMIRESGKKRSASTSKSTTQTSTQFLGVSMMVNSYYAAVDEAQTALSEDAAKLLRRMDVPSFFSACGSYYVRGINRRAEYNAVFKFETSAQTTKSKVKEAITSQVFSMDPEKSRHCSVVLSQHNPWDGGYKIPLSEGKYNWTYLYGKGARLNGQDGLDGISGIKVLGKGCSIALFQGANFDGTSAVLGEGIHSHRNLQNLNGKNFSDRIMSVKVMGPPVDKTDFKKEESMSTLNSAKLTIIASGKGIGKEGTRNLIAFDIATFRKSLKEAFLAMQNPRTGRVTSVEIVPWVENVQVQALLKIDAEASVGKKRIPLYKKKDLLTYNGEYLAELHRSLQFRKARYYLAQSCLEAFQETEMPDWKIVRNHTSRYAGRTVKAMKKLLNKDKIKRILWEKSYLDYLELYGKCVEKMLNGPDRFSGQATVEGLERAGGSARKQLEKQKTLATGRGQKERRLEAGKALYLFRYTDYPECTQIDLAPVPFEEYSSIINCCQPEAWGSPTDLPPSWWEREEFRIAYKAQTGKEPPIKAMPAD